MKLKFPNGPRLRDFNIYIAAEWRRHRQMWIDIAVMFVVLAVGYAFALAFDAGDRLHEWLQEHEDWEFDEIIVQAIGLSFVLGIFSVRRLLELNRALREKTKAEIEAQQLARHDPLTGLPNRRQFFSDLRRRLAGATPEDLEPFAVFTIDLDRFKPINDLYGHRAGDEVLTAVARRLTDTVQARGIVARLGGDEFAILLDPSRDATEVSLRLAQQLITALREPVPIANAVAQTGGSIGIALYPGDGHTAEELVHSSDCAMYHSKSRGRGTYHFFQQEMDRVLQEGIILEQELETAIRDGQIVPYYQELVQLPSRRLIGYEVLARWLHPQKGTIAPATFIPIAEDSGKINKLTLSLLRQVCSDAKQWRDDLIISINVAARQLLDPGFPQQLMAILTTHGFSPRRLQIEITENDLIKRVEEMKVVLGLLRGQGIRIGLDDFGTGYSGLYHLRELPLDTIKIDRSFITNMLTEPDKTRIVEAVLSLTHSLGISTTAEGVETREVGDRLVELGCENAQGFFYGRPKPAQEVDAETTPRLERMAS